MELSYGERSAWISLVSLILACTWYLNTYGGALIEGALGFDDLWAALIGWVILIVIVEAVCHIFMAVDDARRKKAAPGLESDERDALIDVKSERFASFVLGGGAITGIFTAALQPPIFTAHVLLLALVLAQSLKLITQLVYYRRGI